MVFRFLQSKKILARKVEERTEELKNTQSQLLQSEKMAALGTLVAGVAHEINNPTSFSHTAAYNLKRDMQKFKKFLVELTGDEGDKEILNAFDEKFKTLFGHVNSINEGTERISNIVKELRTFSRMEKGEMKRIRLLEGLRITMKLVNAQYKDHVDFNSDFNADPEVMGNAGEINQVFLNILTNSCQAVKEKQKRNGEQTKGKVTVQVREEDDNAVIRIKDSGIGIPQEVLKKIFDPFFTTKPVGESTGLGLSISYSIIQKHGGRIEAASKEGKGTTITIYLPLFGKQTINKERR